MLGFAPLASAPLADDGAIVVYELGSNNIVTGLIAQEVQAVSPEAVVETEGVLPAAVAPTILGHCNVRA